MKFKARLMHIFLISKNFNSDDFLFLLFSAGCLLSRCNVALGLAWLAGCMALNTYLVCWLTGVCFFSCRLGSTHSHTHTPQVGACPACTLQRKGPPAQLGLTGGRPWAAETARLGLRLGPENDTEFSLLDDMDIQLEWNLHVDQLVEITTKSSMVSKSLEENLPKSSTK